MLKRRNGPSAAVGGGCGFKALKQDQSFKLSRVLINHPFKAFNCSSRSRFVMNSRLVNPLFVGFNQSSQSRFAKRTSAELFDPSQVAVPRADPWKARAHCSLILNDSWSRSMDSWCRVILAVSSPQRRTREIIAVLIHPSSIAIPGADPMVWKQFRGAVAEIDPLPSPPPQPHFSHILRLLFITEVSSMLFNPLCIFFLVNTTVSGYALEHSRFLEDEISLELKEEDGECYRMLRSRERSYNGNAKIAKLLLGCDLLKCGVDVNAISRVLLQSCKPSLHTNVDCTALVAAIVSRQVSVVRLLLEAGAKTDVKVRLGAWSWDAASGEEFRVGAGLADPYDITWCAVEYFEESGVILRSLLEHMPPNVSHCGRTLLHHAILCGNAGAVKVLLECGAHVESPVKTTRKTEFCPLHMAVRLGFSTVLKCLIDFGCDIDSKTESSETGLMICARYKQEECLKILLRHGADLGLVNTAGQSASSIAGSNRWQLGFQEAVLSIIRDGKVPKSSNMSIFSPLLFVAQSGDVSALKALIEQGINLDNQDESGFSAVMVAAREGHVDTFRLLVFSGANVRLCNKSGDTALTLCALNHKRDLFEKVLLEFAIEQGNRYAGGFYALHCAARRGDLDAVKVLLSRGYDVNVSDVDGNTPLILAAREGHSQACEVLISHGACCDAKNAKGETALSLARTKHKNEAEQVILDELARKLVLTGSHLQKHTKGGKGALHIKEVRMVEGGILCWGKSSRRNVICQAAEVGPSISFRKTRQRKGDTEEAGLFRVITTKNKEVHFVCEGGFEMAELWVRGLKLVTREAVSGRGNIM